MKRWYVERVESWTVDAETEDDALQIARDGGGSGGTVDWIAVEIEDNAVEIEDNDDAP